MCIEYAKNVHIPPEDPVKCYKRFYLDSDSDFYGTHDYIAQFALDYLVESDPLGRYDWLKDSNQDFLYIYLLGSEYPDYRTIYMKVRPPISFNGISNVGADVIQSHSGIVCANAAMKMAIKTVEYLNRNNYRETVAFFLGAITHYIADLAFPGHFYKPYDPSFGKWLNNQASRKTLIINYQNNGNNGFFNIDLAGSIGYTPDKLNVLDLFKFLPEDSYAKVVYFIAEMMMFTTLLNLEVDFSLNAGDGT